MGVQQNGVHHGQAVDRRTGKRPADTHGLPGYPASTQGAQQGCTQPLPVLDPAVRAKGAGGAKKDSGLRGETYCALPQVRAMAHALDKELILKTVFLLALASGKCRSELHALSRK